MIISRRDIFTEAWKSARRTRGQYRTMRASFAAALRRVWALVKAMATQEEATRRPVAPQRPQAKTWASGNTHRAAAVARRNARLGSLVHACW